VAARERELRGDDSLGRHIGIDTRRAARRGGGETGVCPDGQPQTADRRVSSSLQGAVTQHFFETESCLKFSYEVGEAYG
jgi:hypothetical protein